MPSNPPTRFYWDACVFLAYINGEKLGPPAKYAAEPPNLDEEKSGGE